MTVDVDVLVFDILGTLVDAPAGLLGAITDVLDRDPEEAKGLAAAWEEHVDDAQSAIAEGHRPYVPSDVIDREAADAVLRQIGAHSDGLARELVAAASRPLAWADSAEGLAELATRFPIVGLSNASTATLAFLDRHAGLRWHLALSAAAVHAYKPHPDVYQLAVDAVGLPADRLLMVAAHLWDLRGAAAVGMRTAYVRRPVGDAPTAEDDFDLESAGLLELATVLRSG